jgi:hypothetical protein
MKPTRLLWNTFTPPTVVKSKVGAALFLTHRAQPFLTHLQGLLPTTHLSLVPLTDFAWPSQYPRQSTKPIPIAGFDEWDPGLSFYGLKQSAGAIPLSSVENLCEALARGNAVTDTPLPRRYVESLLPTQRCLTRGIVRQGLAIPTGEGARFYGDRLEVLHNGPDRGRVVFWTSQDLHDALGRPMEWDALVASLNNYDGPVPRL